MLLYLVDVGQEVTKREQRGTRGEESKQRGFKSHLVNTKQRKVNLVFLNVL